MRPDERRERHEAAYICCAGGGQTSGGKVLIVYFTADENREVDAVTSASLATVDGGGKGPGLGSGRHDPGRDRRRTWTSG